MNAQQASWMIGRPPLRSEVKDADLTAMLPRLLQQRDIPAEVDYKNPEDVADAILNAKSSSDSQLKLIEKATKISDWAFQHISTEKGQLIALDKLALNTEYWKEFDGTDLKAWLLRDAKSDAVRNKINSKFKP